MKQSIILLAVLVAASTQAAAHPADNHTDADHYHTEPPIRYSLVASSVVVCDASKGVLKVEYDPIYEGCMYAHRDEWLRSAKKGTAGSQVRKLISQKCERTACNPSWLDELRYK